MKHVDIDVGYFEPCDLIFKPEEAYSNDTRGVEDMAQELARVIGDMNIWEMARGGICTVGAESDRRWKAREFVHSEGGVYW